jgi:acyl dehydratase
MAEAIGDPNPLWVDPTAAQAQGFRDVIAPPTFVDTYNPFYAGEPYPFNPRLPYSFSASDEVFPIEPISPGDVLSVDTRLLDVVQKPRRDGDGSIVFATYEKRYTREADQVLVARWVWTGAYFDGKASALEPRLPEPVDPAWSALTPVTVEMTTTRFVRWAAAIGDYEPVHYDADYARGALGLDGVVGQGALSMAILGRVVTDWVDPREIRRFRVRYVANSLPGQTLFGRGWVQGVHDGLATVRLDLVDSEGRLVTSGDAELSVDLAEVP